MEPAHHRNHQSFDTTRTRTLGPLDSPIGWRQQSTPRAVAGHPMASPIWTPQPGEARMLQQQQQQQQQQQRPPSGHYIADKPLPAQMNFMNSWMGQTTTKYAYYLDRGNGYVTRLIPADVLPSLSEIPAQETTAAGMEILPPLKGTPPTGVQDMNQRVTIKNAGRSSKRDKLYCDKWVHEGICAFEQQGCRYLHDMPNDKATQIALGLFQGYPAWWKKHQTDLQRQRAGMAPAATTHKVDSKQQQHALFGMSSIPRALPSSTRDALANSEPDTPTPTGPRDWRRDGLGASAQGSRRNNRPWSTDATGYQYPLGAIEPPVQRRH